MTDFQVKARTDLAGVPRPKVCPNRTVGNYALANVGAGIVITANTGVQVAAIAAGEEVKLDFGSFIHDEAAPDSILIYDGNPATGTLRFRKTLAPQTAYNEAFNLPPFTSTNGVWLDVQTDWTDAGEKLAAISYRKWTRRSI